MWGSASVRVVRGLLMGVWSSVPFRVFRGFNGGWGMVNLSIVLYIHTIQELKDNVPQPF